MDMKLKALLRSMLRVAAGVGVGLAVIAILFTCFYVRARATGIDTSTVRKSLRFYRFEGTWYADVPQHSRPENRMVAGADTFLEEVSGGGDEVVAVFSSDVADPGEWKYHLHLVEHDKYGGTYRVTAADRIGFKLAWICNVTHTVFGGEHPTDIYIHSVEGCPAGGKNAILGTDNSEKGGL